MSHGDGAAADPVTDPAVVESLRDRLWDAVIEADEDAAVDVVFGALEDGVPGEDLLLDVIAAVQRRVGVEWADNRLTVAAEHAATAINDRVIAALVRHPAVARQTTTGRVAVACADGEWHALPARLLAEVLRLRGWRVDFLGAQVPTPHLIAHLHQHGPDAVALSCSISTRLPTAHAAITACQGAGVPVLVGGAGFGPDGRYARLLGADAWAPDARAAAAQLADGLALTRRAPRDHLFDELPHLADQEYTMVSTTAGRLVRDTVSGLEKRVPAMASYSQLQRQHTSTDVAHIVDFLATALYVDDPELFTGFIAWTAEVLDARGVPVDSLQPTLELLGAQLQDFPRTQRMLSAARDMLHATYARRNG
ncbi:cobalamin B12-binding domain-containing protein [Mycolicibacterium smegmatis]|uniref:Cobalamin B12-binding protein n=4 Tax=Mycolicibacterium smegmatis TaxID=1772 RepID=I7FV35_MYCS2|nr:cobalamin-dependent protein [Mycolicibacterium smegmatis]ABK73831.1 B12 binding domain protein [Mycolicibacterium smegmatis MC2 155]AFP42793.1 Cobalamin B12-binding protein [Mycolicibacterium smegmatis MC2 155]AWT57355.1 B12 binding domain protein [Mycolicibacterium smegmatis MKD8]MBE9621179.1 cobalamin-dependent protein [Mycolicibacterium smegmatis]MBE9627573.1 cobalamin-dependent protein [Mycolicibacterium smegmatis]